MYKVQDEFGRPWAVFEGDPAWKACQALAKRKVKEIVLPRDFLWYGELSVKPATLRALETLECLPSAVVQRLIRLRDCVLYLEIGKP